MPDIFDEVNEDLRAERARQLLRRYGGVLILAAVLIVAAAGAWQFWRWREQQAQEALGARFLQAMKDTAPTPAGAPSPTQAQGAQALTAISEDGPEGYRALARLRLAALKANGGDLPAALALWNSVSADEAADPALRQLADVLWVQHQVDTGAPEIVEGRLQPLLAPSNAWRPLALEMEAWLKLRGGDKPEAAKMLPEILALPSAPDGVRQRAGTLLELLGEKPASLIPGLQG